MIDVQDKMVSLISFGEILWDMIEGQPHLGGAAFNLAAHAARLGMHAKLISCVGNDDLGRQALSEAARLGVDVTSVGCHPVYPTGMVTVQLAGSQPEYTIQGPAAWDFIETAPGPPFGDAGYPADAICFGSLSQRGPQSRQALHTLLTKFAETRAFYDVNLRQDFYSRDIIEWGLHRAAVVKVNEGEADTLSQLLCGRRLTAPEFAREVIGTYGAVVVLVTLGAEGCLVTTPSGMTCVPSKAIAVVDTVGAGDAFSAGFLSAWLRGRSPEEAAVIGNTLGAYTATQRGAVPDYTNHLRMQLNGLGAVHRMGINNANSDHS